MDEPCAERRLLFVANVDWFFRIHFLPLALILSREGFDVTVAAEDTGQGKRIREAGLRFLRWPLSRTGTRAAAEFRSFLRIHRLYRSERPELVHHLGLKAVTYGSIAARFLGIPAVNMVTGLGSILGGAQGTSRLFLERLLPLALRHPASRLLVQNRNDRAFFVRRNWVEAEKVVDIGGVGVETERFAFRPEPEAPPVRVMFAGRMLWDKGVGEYVEAARRLGKPANRAVRFLLVGPADPDQPRSIRPDQLRAWEREGVVEWLGFREDMPEVLAGGHIVVLPSYYGEGLPKVLMEAASAGRAVVATDWPGCRDAVLPGETGLLVPPRDPEALARAVGYLVDHPDIRRSMGRRARRLALERFGVEQAAGRVKRVYELLLNLEPRMEGCHRLPAGKPEETP